MKLNNVLSIMIAASLIAGGSRTWAAQSLGDKTQNLAAGNDPPALDPLDFDKSLKSDQPRPWKGVTKKTASNNRYFLPTGFTFPVRLENAVYSYNVESPAVAVVDEEVQYLKRIVIPSGTRVIGTVAVQQDHNRILITFNTLVFPEGDEIKFTGLGLSLDGSLGIKGKVETHKDSAIADTVLSSVVSGAQEAAMMTTSVNPVATSALSGLAGEATGELGAQRQQITTSISVNADTGLKIFLPRRVEY